MGNGEDIALEYDTHGAPMPQVLGAVYAASKLTYRARPEVFRLLRAQVSFTSTLPRKGYVIVCPECEKPISSELSGLI